MQSFTPLMMWYKYRLGWTVLNNQWFNSVSLNIVDQKHTRHSIKSYLKVAMVIFPKMMGIFDDIT